MKEAKIKSNQTKRSHHPLPHPPSSPSHPTSSSGFHKRDQSRAALAYTAKYKVKHMKCATQFGFVLLFSLARWKVHWHVQKQTFKMIRSYLLKSALTRFIQQVHLNTLTTISNKNTAVFAWWVWRLISQKASVLPSPQYQCGHHQKQTNFTQQYIFYSNKLVNTNYLNHNCQIPRSNFKNSGKTQKPLFCSRKHSVWDASLKPCGRTEQGPAGFSPLPAHYNKGPSPVLCLRNTNLRKLQAFFFFFLTYTLFVKSTNAYEAGYFSGIKILKEE